MMGGCTPGVSANNQARYKKAVSSLATDQSDLEEIEDTHQANALGITAMMAEQHVNVLGSSWKALS
jgi:hypothetical protein